ncbi:hypothetical protein CJF32_00007089 [Rutstroemia sp. NJR-2017a WRK4]|nr:hypothetical protein CJF32_00007089 [Rutstroemia sp. NJR-2017a WRK4]
MAMNRQDRPPSSSKNDNAAFKRNGKGKRGLSNGHANGGEDLHNGEEKEGDNSNKSDSDNSDDDQHTQDRQDGKTDEEGNAPVRVSVRDRICCITWSWFTLTMATGGIANVLYSIPYRSRWLEILGVIVMLLNIVFFITICTLITLRFRWRPGSFLKSVLSQSEALFVPTCSIGTILSNIAQYGVPKTGLWLQTTMQVCFWAYASLSVLSSAAIYLMLWSTVSFPVHSMTPIWTFPAYPLLLVGPVASGLLSALPDSASADRINASAITFGAICFQGLGFLLSLMIYSAFIYRLMTQKLPRETTRPGMFVSVGPSGFTITAIVGLGSSLSKVMPNGYMGNTQGPFILKLLANMTGLFLWGLCLWFSLISLAAHWQVVQPHHPEHHIHFDITWNSFIFPNTALITATAQIGTAFQSKAIQIFGTVIAVILVVVWLGVLFLMVRALVLRRLLWPGDVDSKQPRREGLAWVKPGTDARKSREQE